MARESVAERQARLLPGAVWLAEQRKGRGWSGQQLGELLGVRQERISAYERAQDQLPLALVPRLAAVLELPEVEVWKGLNLPLPAELQTHEAVVAYYLGRHPGILDDVEAKLAAARQGNPGRKQRHSGVKPPDVTQEGDPAPTKSQRRASGV